MGKGKGKAPLLMGDKEKECEETDNHELGSIDM